MNGNKYHIPSLQELRNMRKPLRNVNIEYRAQLKNLEKFAVWVTEHVGNMGFFIVIFLWTVSWFFWNMFGPEEMRFDPFPGFVLWLFISNMIQLFLMPLIMIGQNIQGRRAEVRSEADYEVNNKAEREVEVVILHLEHQNELLEKIIRKMEKEEDTNKKI
jgi:uncharacterized membrane protein